MKTAKNTRWHVSSYLWDLSGFDPSGISDMQGRTCWVFLLPVWACKLMISRFSPMARLARLHCAGLWGKNLGKPCNGKGNFGSKAWRSHSRRFAERSQGWQFFSLKTSGYLRLEVAWSHAGKQAAVPGLRLPCLKCEAFVEVKWRCWKIVGW